MEHQGFWKEDTVLKNRRLVAQFAMTRPQGARRRSQVLLEARRQVA